MKSEHAGRMLNCCIYWTTSVILLKFAEYVKWILICYPCKFGEYSCYNSRDPKGFIIFWPALYSETVSSTYKMREDSSKR